MQRDVPCSARRPFVGQGQVDKGVEAMSALKGIGPATASAVLAAGLPAEVPFMSDELVLVRALAAYQRNDGHIVCTQIM